MKYNIVRSIRLHRAVSTWQRAEKKIKLLLEKRGYVNRTDYGQGLPDFIAIQDGITGFIEVKNYRTKSNLEDAFNEWKTNQPNQVKNFEKIIKAGGSIDMAIFTNRSLHHVRLSL